MPVLGHSSSRVQRLGPPRSAGAARDATTVQETAMKVLVPVKRVLDFNVKLHVKADGSGVDLANVKGGRHCH